MTATAYRQKSLQLHPDKLAQRGQTMTEEQATEYNTIQQAYAILTDEKQRQMYHAMGMSPARHHFWTTGGLHHPTACLENLSRASCENKTRLVLISALILCAILLQPILLAARVNAIHNEAKALHETSWILIFMPTWLYFVGSILFWAFLAIVVPDQRWALVVSCLENVAWFIGGLLLTIAWDRADGRDTSWHALATPFYCAIICRIYGLGLQIQSIRRDQARMVTLDYLQQQQEATSIRTGNDRHLTEEHIAELARDHIIVTHDPEEFLIALKIMEQSQPEAPSLSVEDIEALKVSTSAEFRAADDAVHHYQQTIAVYTLIWIPLTALIASKVDGDISVSWWVIFLPLWLYFVGQIVASCSMACCGTAAPEIVIIESSTGNGADETAANDPSSDGPAAQPPPQSRATDENQPNSQLGGNQPLSTGHTTEVSENRNRDAAAIDVAEHCTDERDGIHVMEMTVGVDTSKGDKMNRSTDASQSFTNWAPSEGEIKELASLNDLSNKQEKVDNDRGDDVPPEADDDPGIEVDEETYRAWKSAFAKAEESAQERQMRATMTCCCVCFQAIILCLTVAKLDDDYPPHSESEGESSGFNAFWVMFPVFFVAGLMLCCCSCGIYCAAGLEDLIEEHKDDPSEEHDPEADASEAVEVDEISPQAEEIHTDANDQQRKEMGSNTLPLIPLEAELRAEEQSKGDSHGSHAPLESDITDLD